MTNRKHYIDKLLQSSWAYIHSSRRFDQLFPSEYVIRLLAPFFDSGYTLIDIGSGNGKNSLSLQSRFSYTFLFDYALDEAFLSAKQSRQEFFYQNCNILSLDIQLILSGQPYKNQPRLFLASQFIDHILPEDIELFFKCLSRIMRQNDVLIITFFDSKSNDNFLSVLSKTPYAQTKLRFFDLEMNSRLPIDITKVAHPFELHTYIDLNYIKDLIDKCLPHHSISRHCNVTEGYDLQKSCNENVSITALTITPRV